MARGLPSRGIDTGEAVAAEPFRDEKRDVNETRGDANRFFHPD